MKYAYAMVLLCALFSSSWVTAGSDEEQEMTDFAQSKRTIKQERQPLIYQEPAYRKDFSFVQLNIPQMTSGEKCAFKIAASAVTIFFCTAAVLVVSYPLSADRQPQVQTCSVDMARYPVCGSTTQQGVGQNQVAFANLLGNMKRIGPRGTPNHLIYGLNYCSQPTRTICTDFKPEAYKNLPASCYALNHGKLVGVTTLNNETQHAYVVHDKANDCLDAPRLVERALNASGKPYCKIDPRSVGFTIQNAQPILLTLFLIAANSTLSSVDPKRWAYPESMNDIEGTIWGLDSNCKATWSNNVDPSASLQTVQQKEAKYKQNILNATKLLKRYNTVVQKKNMNKRKFVKTKHH